MSDQVSLRGRRVTLRPVIEADRTALVAIRRTEAVRRWWKGTDLDAEFAEDLADEETIRLAVVDERDTVIGLVQFTEEDDPEYRHASIDIYIDPAVHRQGVATDALTTVVTHLFDDLGHHRLTIDPAATNSAAINCYAGIGFQPVGVMRQYERQPDGSWTDGLLMELLLDDRPR
ncbi:MAG: GNAT family protein [Actinomycetota bacterium]